MSGKRTQLASTQLVHLALTVTRARREVNRCKGNKTPVKLRRHVITAGSYSFRTIVHLIAVLSWVNIHAHSKHWIQARTYKVNDEKIRDNISIRTNTSRKKHPIKPKQERIPWFIKLLVVTYLLKYSRRLCQRPPHEFPSVRRERYGCCFGFISWTSPVLIPGALFAASSSHVT